MNQLTRGKQIDVVKALVEGNSVRATVRMTGVAKNTIQKLLLEIGEACYQYHDTHVRNLKSKRIQCDEIWNFVYAKDKNLPAGLRNRDDHGSIWTWTAIDSDSKLAVSWLCGKRDAEDGEFFMRDVADRLANRVQLTTDGHTAYLVAVDAAFNGDVDYAMLVKRYGKAPEGPETRYSPAICTGAKKTPITGNPDNDHISTSYVERQNLTMRMSMRRFTRLTNAFSKKLINLQAAVALHYMYYNFVRVHQSLQKQTPAMVAGLTDHKWSVGGLIDLLDNFRFEAALK